MEKSPLAPGRLATTLLFFVALFAVLAPDARAATVAGLYEAEVAWDGDRDAAFSEALGQVLVRMTGRRDAASAPELAPLMASAARYAQQFRNPTPDTLWVAFDGEALARALTELGEPLWGSERPGTLVWLAVDLGGGQRFVVPSEPENPDEAALRERLQAAARARGIPLIFPLMDAQDRAQASFSEVWGGFDDAITSASARYGVDAILVGRLSAGDFDRGRWVLYTGQARDRWVGGIEESVDRVADTFATRYAVVPSGQPSVATVRISGVESIEDYGRVMRLFSELTAVATFNVEQVESDTLTLRVGLRGDAGQLDRSVRLDGLLEPVSVSTGPSAPELAYRIAR